MDTIKIKRDNSKFKRLLFITPISFFAVGKFTLNCLEANNNIYKVLAVVGFLFCILMIVFSINAIRKIRTKTYAIELNEHGLVDNVSLASAGLIKWEEIKDVESKIVSSQPHIVIKVFNPEKFIKAKSGMKRGMINQMNKDHGSPIVIDTNQINKSGKEVVELISDMQIKWNERD